MPSHSACTLCANPGKLATAADIPGTLQRAPSGKISSRLALCLFRCTRSLTTRSKTMVIHVSSCSPHIAPVALRRPLECRLPRADSMSVKWTRNPALHAPCLRHILSKQTLINLATAFITAPPRLVPARRDPPPNPRPNRKLGSASSCCKEHMDFGAIESPTKNNYFQVTCFLSDNGLPPSRISAATLQVFHSA